MIFDDIPHSVAGVLVYLYLILSHNMIFDETCSTRWQVSSEFCNAVMWTSPEAGGQTIYGTRNMMMEEYDV